MARIAPYLSYNQRRLVCSSLFTGQLSYRPLIRTFCPTQSNHLINKLQEQALRVTYSHYGSSFSELPEMANESTIYRKKIKVLMTEIYKFLNGLSPPIMNDIFKKHYYTLRNLRSLVSKCKFSTTYGIVLSLQRTTNSARSSWRH